MQCKFKTEQGKQCEAYAMKGSDLCFSHSPDTKERHLEATAKGGATSRDLGTDLLPSIPLKNADDVIGLLQETINKVRVVKKDGSIDIRVANCIGYLSGQLLKAIEVGAIANRLDVVERIILERKPLTQK